MMATDRVLRAATLVLCATACSRSQTQELVPAASQNAFVNANLRAAHFAVIYDFKRTDGAYPLTSLVLYGRLLYGTTPLGGSRNEGSVFSITSAGAARVLHRFQWFRGHGDGDNPFAPLTVLHGAFYATTANGGAYPDGQGTAFRIDPSGTVHILHKFGSGNDGVQPEAGLTPHNGQLFGTTSAGGTYYDGTIFRLSSNGREVVLHNFRALSADDGSNPQASLTMRNGIFFSTTLGGGQNNAGTVYSISPSGTERVLYSFQLGARPLSGLIALRGGLYGTTAGGGAHGEGTVYTINPSRGLRVLHSFGAPGDGFYPTAGLTALNGTLYGTTLGGGAHDEGTIFTVTSGGTERVVYSFHGGADGYAPAAGLTVAGGVLYATTEYGGRYGYGTLFAVTP